MTRHTNDPQLINLLNHILSNFGLAGWTQRDLVTSMNLYRGIDDKYPANIPSAITRLLDLEHIKKLNEKEIISHPTGGNRRVCRYAVTSIGLTAVSQEAKP